MNDGLPRPMMKDNGKTPAQPHICQRSKTSLTLAPYDTNKRTYNPRNGKLGLDRISDHDQVSQWYSFNYLGRN